MSENTKKTSVQKGIILRILPEEFLITLSYARTKSRIQTSFIRWKLSKKIDPNHIGQDIDLLSDHLQRLAKLYQLEGNTVTVVFPQAISNVKTIEIPLDLSKRNERSEYQTLIKEPYEFWKEFDDDLVDYKDAEIRANYLYTKKPDNESVLLYSATSKKIIDDYTSMVLNGNLYPTRFVPESQSIIQAVYTSLSEAEKNRPFCVFHLSPNNNKLIYVGLHELTIAKVDISDLDETLLNEIPKKEETQNEFWDEVATRISGNLKQAFTFLKDEIQTSNLRTIFLISDYEKEDIIFDLIHKNFKLANLRSLKHQFECVHLDKGELDKTLLERNLPKVSKISSSSGLAPNIGAYKLKNIRTLNSIIRSSQLDLHPQSQFIQMNFDYVDTLKKITLVLTVVIGLQFLYGLYSKSTLIDLNNPSSEYRSLVSDLKLNRLKVAELQKDTNTYKSQTQLLNASLQGILNDEVYRLINKELPEDLELEQLLIKEKSFAIYGNGRSVSEINRFYRKMLAINTFKDIKIDVFKRNDAALDYFEITGSIGSK